MKEGVILIPARYESSRFPGKPLVPLKGRPLIQWVYENAAKTGLKTMVVTDHEGIEKAVRAFGGEVCRVDDAVESGTERIFLAVERHLGQTPEWILNVQGDEPLLTARPLQDLVEFHLKHSFDISTLVKEKKDAEEQKNPNVVKAVYSALTGQCHYFSRAPVPFSRDQKKAAVWYQHIGVYLYRFSALKKFCQAPVSFYEDIEKLEQLRALEMGLKIGASLTEATLQGVDTPEDLKKVERILQGE